MGLLGGRWQGPALMFIDAIANNADVHSPAHNTSISA